MADAMAEHLENKVLDHTLGVSQYTYQAGPMWIALFDATGTALDSNTLTGEISGFDYARTSVTMSAAASGATSNSADVTFPAANGGSWGTVRYAAIMDASTLGNVLYWGQLTQDKVVDDGDTFKFNAGGYQLSIG